MRPTCAFQTTQKSNAILKAGVGAGFLFVCLHPQELSLISGTEKGASIDPLDNDLTDLWL